MKISPNWLREFVNLKAEDRKLAEELTHTGTAVESISHEHGQTIFEMEITTNRVDCMNHYGIARECSAVFDVDLKPLKTKLPRSEEHTSELQSRFDLVCRLLLEKKKNTQKT